MTHDILSMNLAEIEALMTELGQPAYHAKQIFGWLHQNNVTSFSDMTNVSKSLRAELEASGHIASVNIAKRIESQNDDTVKYLFTLNDNTQIESVLMKYSHGYSVCVSTQAGCKMGCTFCASGENFSRNLTAGEICAQVYHATRDCDRVGGVVLMGCGEPLDNFDAVMRFIELISHPDGLNIGQRHITLSTCGLVPRIFQLAEMKMQITLAISLHAPSDDLRQTFMPIAKRYGLKELLSACRHYIEATHRRITFEYALARGVNDSPSHAKALAKLLKGLNCHINLIPINKARGAFSPTARKEALIFAEILQESRIQTTIRRSLGGDVGAACGQLRSAAAR